MNLPPNATLTKDLDGEHHLWNAFGDPWCEDAAIDAGTYEPEEEQPTVLNGLLYEEAQLPPDDLPLDELKWCSGCKEALDEEGA